MDTHPSSSVLRDSPAPDGLRCAPDPSRALSWRAVSGIEDWLIGRIRRRLGEAPVRLVLWNGTEIPLSTGPVVATVVIHNAGALWDIAVDPDRRFGDAYSSGRVDVEGDLLALLDSASAGGSSGPSRARLVFRWLAGNTFSRSRANVHHHYDIGNDFYRLWLDDQLVYTCAYFPTPDATLEDAQVAKMRHVCRKLALTSGETVVEAGCGWGALALYMARHYGVRVKAFNISHEQIEYARRRAAEEGLSAHVDFIEDDYRNIRGPYDVFVSIGMLEHVGREFHETFGRIIDRALDPRRGRGLLHFIGRNQPALLNAWIRARIFPGGYPPTLHEVCESILEPAGLSILDVENLRLHYAKTLDHWRRRFERASDRIRAMFGEPFVRAWRLYLTGSEAAFHTGWMQLFQITFARGTLNDLPWVRPDGGPAVMR
ncbi:MAG: class I SAM-dependent methyltransferase [Acidobacteria bacterium]|nr:class I SAM-dependent methyltransferase [Acidobacteriota bacterium]